MTGKPDGRRTRHAGRRPELLSAAVDYVVQHGLAGLSMRPLAAGIGITHRTLLHHFGSKEDLLVEVFRAVRARQRAVLAPHLQELSVVPVSRFPHEAWLRLGAEGSEPLFRLFFEVWSQALQAPERYDAFLKEVVGDWLPLVETMLARDGCPPEKVSAFGSVVVAVFRGLMLDVLSTHDRQRIDEAFHAFHEMLDTMCTLWREP
jgi:AcrR family transcriptional regulator